VPKGPNSHRVIRIAVLVALVGGGAYAWYRYSSRPTAEQLLQAQIRKLEEEKQRLEAQKKHLEAFVRRLTDERRVAQLLVNDQVKKGDQIVCTSLTFVELDRNGRIRNWVPLEPIRGNVIHVEALVVHFEQGYIEKDDPLRNHSIALFTRIYGDHQAPVDGQRLDLPGKIPAYYCDESLSREAAEFEQELWTNFWRLAEDPQYRKDKGVSLAQGEGPWVYVYKDYSYTLTAGGNAGLRIRQEPLSIDMRQALSHP